MGHNQYAHKHKLKVMDETFSAWIERHKRVVENHAFHLDERPIMESNSNQSSKSRRVIKTRTNFHS